MLKTNSKAARENVRKYIIENAADAIADYAAYERVQCNINDTSAALAYVYGIFLDEMKHEVNRCGTQNAFTKWAQGLAFGGLFLYYYSRSAVDDLGAILQETEAEKARYSESDAERVLTLLIFRELERASRNN